MLQLKKPEESNVKTSVPFSNSRFSNFAQKTALENFEQRWLNVEELLKERFGKKPDLEGVLFLVGLNELGAPSVDKWTKEQKQDIMHVAVCTLLAQLGHYEFAYKDVDGWPHFNELERPMALGLMNQERLLKECVIRYFDQ